MGKDKWRLLDLYVDSYADATMAISPAIFYGLNVLDGVERIEGALKNSPFNETMILKRIEDVYQKSGLQIGNAFPKDILFPLLEAAKRAKG